MSLPKEGSYFIRLRSDESAYCAKGRDGKVQLTAYDPKTTVIKLSPTSNGTYEMTFGAVSISPSDSSKSNYRVRHGAKKFPWAIEALGGSDYRIRIPDQNVYWYAEKDNSGVKPPDAPKVDPTVTLARAVGDPGEIWIIKSTSEDEEELLQDKIDAA